MTDDATPTAPAPTTTSPEGTDGNNAATVAIGRPTPSPDQLLPPSTASSSKSDSSSPLSGGDIEIGQHDTSDGSKQDNASSPDSNANASSEVASSAKSDFSSPLAGGDLEIEGQPLIDDTSDVKQEDASSPIGDAKAAMVPDRETSFVTTPSPFKKQLAALAGAFLASADAMSDEKQNSIDASVNYSRDDEKLSPPPQFPMSNFRSDGLLSGSLIGSPDPLLADANVTDFELLGREVMAAASTASAMLSRSDGFESMPAAWNGMNGGLDTTSQFSQYPGPDTFPLPLNIQNHLDETYARSTVTFPHNPNAGDTFFQVTAFRPRNGVRAPPGWTPPTFSAHASSGARRGGGTMEYDTTGLRGKTLEQLAQLPIQPSDVAAAAAKKKNVKTRPRPLPLRKRKLKVMKDDSGDEEYTPPSAAETKVPVAKKRAPLVRHNVRELEDGDRITCKCSKSKCLKLYCDCFQQGKVCSPTECECKGCKNTESNSGPNGIRTKTINQILARRPDAFQPRTRDAEEGCRCKKNKCLKKYCICFNAGEKCDSRCRCRNCQNQPGSDDVEEENVAMELKTEIEFAPPAMLSSEIVFQPPAEYREAQPDPVASISPLDESAFREPPKLSGISPPQLPGGFNFGFGSPPALPNITNYEV